MYRRDTQPVHMTEVTLTELRKDLFRLADAALAGEPVVIRRKGRRLVLREEVDGPAEEDAGETAEERAHRERMERFWASPPPPDATGLELEDMDLSDHWDWSGGPLK